MTDLLAIVSKAVFAREMKTPSVGTRYRTDRYLSTSKALTPLTSGGSLFQSLAVNVFLL